MTEGMDKSTVEHINALDEISSNVELKSNEEIDRLITETEETLSALMGELKRRQEDNMHHEIENLDVYMQEADISFKNLRNFIAMALAELRGDK